MNFFGIGGLEFVLIFGIALFVVGPKRLAEGVRSGRKYYTELKRHRDELTSLVNEAIDAEEIKKDLKKDIGDPAAVRKELEGVKQDLTLDQIDIGLTPTRSVPRTSARARPVDRGDGKIGGKEIPAIDLGSAAPAAEPTGDGGGRP